MENTFNIFFIFKKNNINPPKLTEEYTSKIYSWMYFIHASAKHYIYSRVLL